MSETIPLTHFEELMLHQDSSAYPVSCFVRLRFEGRLVRAAFESAACVAIGSHPLLHAVVEKQKRYVWRVGDVAPKITWTDGDHQPEPEMRQLDITAEYGLRFFVRLYENRSDVLIQLHHACCDGIAMSDPELLLDGIQREMNQIKRLELGHLFSFALRPQRLVPGALRRAARPGRCCVTAVFTNIGRVLARCPGVLSWRAVLARCPLPCVDGRWQAGNVVLLATEVAAPIARNVCASFGVTSYAGRLSLSLHYDARVLSPSAAKTLLSMFARKVETSAGVRTNETLESVELI
jgi:hypothetical protein